MEKPADQSPEPENSWQVEPGSYDLIYRDGTQKRVYIDVIEGIPTIRGTACPVQNYCETFRTSLVPAPAERD